MKNKRFIMDKVIFRRRFIFLVMVITVLFACNSYCLAQGTLGKNNQMQFSARNHFRLDGDRKKYAPGQMIIKFKDDSVLPREKVMDLSAATGRSIEKSSLDAVFYSTRSEALNSVNAAYGLRSVEVVIKSIRKKEKIKAKFPKRAARVPRGTKTPDLSNLYIFHFPQDANIKEIAEEYMRDPSVEYAYPNYIVRKHASLPNDTYVDPDPNDDVWATGSFVFVGSPNVDLWGLKMIEADGAWEINKGSADVVVAVIDTGVDYNHVDIKENIWVNSAEDLNGNGIVEESDFDGKDNDNNGYIDDIRGWDFIGWDKDPMDSDGHGTHVAGTVAALTNNQEGVAGVSWHSKIMCLDAFRYASDAIKAVVYATDNGADIINMSLGVDMRDENDPSKFITDPFIDSMAYAYAHGVVVVVSAGNEEEEVNYWTPARRPETIAVAAVDQNDERSDFSNYGPELDVAAPGEWIISLRAAGTNMYDDDNYLIPYGSSNAKYLFAFGTSMAAPHVAGAAALILSQSPNLTVDEVRSILRETSDDLGDVGRDDYYGYGRINMKKALEAVPSLPDLIIDKFVIDGQPRVNQAVGIEAAVANQGDKNGALSFLTRIYDGDKTICETNGSLLEGQPSFSFSCQWTPQTKGKHILKVKADVRNEVNETNDNNNTSQMEVDVLEESLSVPKAPQDLKGEAISSSRIDLHWDDKSSNEDGFEIWRSLDEGAIPVGYQKIDTGGEDITTYSDTNVEVDTYYWYKVCAYNASGASSFTNQVFLTTKETTENTQPSKPILLHYSQ